MGYRKLTPGGRELVGEQFRTSFCGRLRFELVTGRPRFPYTDGPVRSPDACRRALTRSSGSGARSVDVLPRLPGGRTRAARRAGTGARGRAGPRGRTRGRRPPGGRSPAGARGSGACGRSRAAPAAACRSGSVALGLEVRDRGARVVGVGRHPRAHAAVAAERRVDRAAPRGRAALDQREVLAGDLARAQRRLQRGVRRLVAGEHEQAGRVAVEPVHDARALRVGPAGDAARQRLHERARRVPVRRDGRRRRRACRPPAGARPRRRSRTAPAATSARARPRRGSSTLDRLAAARARGASAAARRRRARSPASISRCAAAREPACVGEEDVEPLARRLGRDVKLAWRGGLSST